MEHTIITDAAHVTAAWLEAALARAGALAAGGVQGFEIQGERATWSHNARLRVRYQPGSAGELPESLFLKMVQAAEFGPSEVQYYARDYLGAPDAPLIRCYDARYSETLRAYHILLQDLSATYSNTWERPVTPAFVRALADALAALHAHRWTLERIAEVGERLPGHMEIGRYLDHIRPGLAPLLAIAGDDMRPEWRAMLPEIFERHPPLMLARTRDPRGICMVHGDVNPGNIMAPLNDDAPVYLVDRQPFDWSQTVWLGASDLSYLMCSFWPEETRRAFELPLLRHYHEGLLRRGIAGYPWERLWQDYRLAAVQAVYVAVEWCVLEEDRERMRWLWTMELRRAMAAFEDLRCRELFPST
jgi:hypothetical protein